MDPMIVSKIVIAVAVVLGIVVAPMAFIALFRYFDHRETMRRLERLDGGQLVRLDLAELRMRERWRVQSGILGGACTAALGVAVLVGGWLIHSEKMQSAHQAGYFPPADTGLGMAIGFGIFLLLVGAIIMVGHLIFSRHSSVPDDEAAAAQSPTPSDKA